MSLDVYLKSKEPVTKTCECCGSSYQEIEMFYTSNITLNLRPMAMECGLLVCIWRPGEVGIKTAGELIEPLQIGLKKLKDDPQYFKQHAPSNGWGSYNSFVQFVEDYLNACIKYPDAEIKRD